MTDAPPDPGELRQFLLGLAEGMTAAGESVDRVRTVMRQITVAYDVPHVSFVVLPTVILVQTGAASTAHVAISSSAGASLRFDQIAQLYALVHRAEDGAVTPADGIAELNAIGRRKPRFGWLVRTLGHGLLTLGLAMLLFPSWHGAAIAFGLGLVIGLMKLVRSSTLDLIFPVVASFVSALLVFVLARHFGYSDPISILIAPLVTFLPGGLLTTATVELASGQMIAGASRLVSGLVQLALLAFGILAAGTLVGVSDLDYVATDTLSVLGWWVPLLGVLALAVGNYLHFSAPARTFGWVLLVLVIAYAGQLLGGLVFGASLSGFFGAFFMTPAVLWIDAFRRGVPSQLTFLPAFWLLVPGASGLIGITEVVGAHYSATDFTAALVTVMSIALGVLLGTAAYRMTRYGADELQHFHVDLPGSDRDVAREAGPSFWKRIRKRGQ